MKGNKMFIVLHAFGEAIFINMDHVYDFHADQIGGKGCGSLLHFTRAVQPYGEEAGTHWKKHVDESPYTILVALAEARGRAK
jgi:hypothetical protein